MESSFSEQLQKGAFYLEQERFEDSILEYTMALKNAINYKQKRDLNLVLGRLYQKANKPEKAVAAFEASLKLYDLLDPEKEAVAKAALHNNLAAAYMTLDIEIAISHYKSALSQYISLAISAQEDFLAHLANTHFALAEAFLQKAALAQAKTHFKEAIKGYEKLPELKVIKARAHYQLGLIYTEEFNLYDAKTQYTKALEIYEKEEGFGQPGNKPVIAALHNNLAITFKSLEEPKKAIASYKKTLELYKALSKSQATVFLPYVAATYSSLAIAFAEIQLVEKAIDETRKALAIYNDLADSHPDDYTHYLATSLHNLGLFYFELKAIDEAEHFFSEALSLRKKIAVQAPTAFDADVCASALNLVELNQYLLENQLDISYKEKSLALLEDVKERLNTFEDSRLVIKNMNSDCTYYQEYFNTINLEKLSFQRTKKTMRALQEEINSTIFPREKMTYQEQIVSLLKTQFEQYPKNEELRQLLAYAKNDQGWLYLRLQEPENALTQIQEGEELDERIGSLKCNRAHAYLLLGHLKKAEVLYRELISTHQAISENYTEIISKDLEKLEADGVDTSLINRIKNRISLPL